MFYDEFIGKKVRIGVAFLTEDGSCPHTKNIMKVLLKLVLVLVANTL